jgi:hypothetical protein
LGSLQEAFFSTLLGYDKPDSAAQFIPDSTVEIGICVAIKR